MKHRLGLVVGLLLLAVGVCAWPGSSQAKLTERAAEKRFDGMVIRYHRHLTGKHRGGGDCEFESKGTFYCEGRWKVTAPKNGKRTRFTYSAQGAVENDRHELMAWGQLTRWESRNGVTKGPIPGALISATWAH
jgi:hypothetical protein